MMTGTLIENNVWTGYLSAVFLAVAGFAIYDIFHRRVPDKALACFLVVAALAPAIRIHFILEYSQPYLAWPVLLESMLGAVFGFAIPLAAAMVTGGNGIGGGDIKFCGVLGLVYGPSGMAVVFLVAAGLAMPVILMLRRLSREYQPVTIPFLPFLACGCSAATLAQLFR